MNYFVFVVCGAKEYIEQLNFSLRFLRFFSKYPILVITDKSRNESVIEHDTIIDLKTSEKLNHHQAHLYLETKLPHYLNLNENDIYCYLDSDVVAVNEKINDVFNHYSPPLTFAKDHCTINKHSPHAIKCSCLSEHLQNEADFNSIISQLPQIASDQVSLCDHQKLEHIFKQMKKYPLLHLFDWIYFLINRYIFSLSVFKFKSYIFRNSDKTWINKSESIIEYDFKYYQRFLKLKYGLIFNKNKKQWVNKNGDLAEPHTPSCSHLQNHFKTYYNLNVSNNYRHWNGGVFIINQESKKIMEYWHKITVEEIQRGKLHTKYIDQVTITAAAFKFNLPHKETLPIEYNFITDYEHKGTRFKADKGYTYNGFKTTFEPAFLHIYHHWGDKNWDIWQSVTNLGEKLKIID